MIVSCLYSVISISDSVPEVNENSISAFCFRPGYDILQITRK